jgi:hypothetical protein
VFWVVFGWWFVGFFCWVVMRSFTLPSGIEGLMLFAVLKVCFSFGNFLDEFILTHKLFGMKNKN